MKQKYEEVRSVGLLNPLASSEFFQEILQIEIENGKDIILKRMEQDAVDPINYRFTTTQSPVMDASYNLQIVAELIEGNNSDD